MGTYHCAVEWLEYFSWTTSAWTRRRYASASRVVLFLYLVLARTADELAHLLGPTLCPTFSFLTFSYLHLPRTTKTRQEQHGGTRGPLEQERKSWMISKRNRHGETERPRGIKRRNVLEKPTRERVCVISAHFSNLMSKILLYTFSSGLAR